MGRFGSVLVRALVLRMIPMGWTFPAFSLEFGRYFAAMAGMNGVIVMGWFARGVRGAAAPHCMKWDGGAVLILRVLFFLLWFVRWFSPRLGCDVLVSERVDRMMLLKVRSSVLFFQLCSMRRLFTRHVREVLISEREVRIMVTYLPSRSLFSIMFCKIVVHSP